MPFNLAGHCTVHIGGDLFLIAGGFHKDYKSPSDKVFLQVRWIIVEYLNSEEKKKGHFQKLAVKKTHNFWPILIKPGINN